MPQKTPKQLDAIVDKVLSYRPTAKSEPARQRKRRRTILEKKRKFEDIFDQTEKKDRRMTDPTPAPSAREEAEKLLQSDENRLNWLAAQGISTMVFSSHEMLARLKVLRALLSEQEELRRLAGQAETSQRGQLLAEAENATGIRDEPQIEGG